MNDGKWLSLKEAQRVLKENPGKPSHTIWEQGQLRIAYYELRGKDKGTPHTQDEIYVVLKGRGKFFCDGETKPFNDGDFLFVPAYAEHRFLDFSDDMSVWVIFYGPEGGDKV